MPAKLTAVRPYLFVLSIVTLTGCNAKEGGDSQAGQPATNGAATASATTKSDCPTVSDVSTIVGFEVRKLTGQMYGDQLVCGYMEAGDDAGMQVTAYREPESQADEDLSRMAMAVKAMGGESANLETISIGERGQAYGSPAKSEAAAVFSGRYYHVEIIAGAGLEHGDKKDAAIALLKRMIG